MLIHFQLFLELLEFFQINHKWDGKKKVKSLRVKRFPEQNNGISNNEINVKINENNQVNDNNDYASQRNNDHRKIMFNEYLLLIVLTYLSL